MITGCTNLNTTKEKEEVKIKTTEGIGILSFQAVVNKMLTNTYNYVLLTIRNNADGSSAKNIKVKLENVEPFTLYECSEEHNASDIRENVCNDFFDDVGISYRSHKLNQMLPDEEVQFFWNIKAPTDNQIVGMQYQHTVYYSLEYDYTSTITQTIAGISQSEYLKESKEGPVTLKGQTISSPGEIKIESKTQQPIIYLEGGASDEPTNFNLELEITNKGEGVPKPGSSILIAVKKDPLTQIDEKAYEMNWYPYDKTNQTSFEEFCTNYATHYSCEQESVVPRNADECYYYVNNNEKINCLNNFNEELNTQYCNQDTDCIKYYDERMSGKLTRMFDNTFKPIDYTELGAEDSSTRKGLILSSINSEELNSGNYNLILPITFDTSGIYEPQKILTFTTYISYIYLKEGSTSISVFPSK